MKPVALGLVICSLTFHWLSPARADEGAASPDEAAIRTNAEMYVEAYNRRDSKSMASLWSPDAVYSDPTTGERIEGRDAIARHFDYLFAGSEDAKLAVTIGSVEFVSPNVAIEKGTAVVTYSDFEPESTNYSAVHMKRDGQWLLDRVSEEEAATPPPSHYEHLKELEWLVGAWVDADERVSIQSEIEWTRNRNFLRRSFGVVVRDQVDMSGMQVIGWDAAMKQIRSWTFDSDGGVTEATWTHKDGQWFIQNNGTLADGRKATSLNILTYVNNDTFRWESVNRELDGELLPNVEAVTVVRSTADETAKATE